METVHMRKRQEAAMAKRRVEEANKQQRERELSLENLTNSKKQRVEDIRRQE